MLGIALQKAVAHIVLTPAVGVDLVQTQLEPLQPFGDLAVV